MEMYDLDTSDMKLKLYAKKYFYLSIANVLLSIYEMFMLTLVDKCYQMNNMDDVRRFDKVYLAHWVFELLWAIYQVWICWFQRVDTRELTED